MLVGEVCGVLVVGGGVAIGVEQGAAGGQLLGQAVPPPGVIRLGSVDTGLNAIASRGDVSVTIQRVN